MLKKKFKTKNDFLSMAVCNIFSMFLDLISKYDPSFSDKSIKKYLHTTMAFSVHNVPTEWCFLDEVLTKKYQGVTSILAAYERRIEQGRLQSQIWAAKLKKKKKEEEDQRVKKLKSVHPPISSSCLPFHSYWFFLPSAPVILLCKIDIDMWR